MVGGFMIIKYVIPTKMQPWGSWDRDGKWDMRITGSTGVPVATGVRSQGVGWQVADGRWPVVSRSHCLFRFLETPL